MLSALQAKVGGSTSSSHDPYPGLHYQRIASRCVHVTSSISCLPLKELHQFFPHLLSNIFGFDGSEGWGLRLFNKTQHGDFHQLLQFLAPHGALFQLIEKLEEADFVYEFPVGCLPRPSQQALTEGVIPPFYSDKVQLSLSVDNSPTHIFLSAFDYYFFHFAYYLVFTQENQPSSRPSSPSTDSLFVTLFDSYISHFLPFTGVVLPSSSVPFRQGTPQYNSPPYLNASFGSSRVQSPGYGVGMSSPIQGGSRLLVSSPKQATQPTLSETFVQVLVEFWLNQNTYNGGKGDLLAQAQNQFTPSEEHMIFLRRLLKQVHYFSCGSSYHSSTPTSHSALFPVTDTLRSFIIPMYIQKRLFHFLHYSFKHSPLDASFRYILELWLTYIQPWRYTDPSKPSTENKGNFENLSKKWQAFVLDNLPFYTTLLVEFLGRCFQADFTQENNVTFLYRTSKAFAVTELMGFIRQGEGLLLDSTPLNSSKGNSPLSSSSSSSSVKAVFIDCVGHSFDYTPLFGQNTIEAIHSLLYKVCHSKVILSGQSSSQGSQVSQPTALTPSTPSESFFSLATSQQPTQKSVFRRLWDSIVDIFSEDFQPNPGSFAVQLADPKKLVNMLDTVIQNLSNIFELPIPKVTSSDSSMLGDAVPPLEASYLGHTYSSPLPPSLEPEFIRGSDKLSPQGKMQVIQGIRKCSGKNVQYQGDPVLQPIRSYENATLVRLLYRVSSMLNEKYSNELAAVGRSEGLVHKLLLQLLSSPPPRDLGPIIQNSTEPPVTPVHRVAPLIDYSDEGPPASRAPRISLRPFGSYYTLSYILLALVFVWLFSIPSLYCIIGLLCFLVVFCIISYCIHGTPKKYQ